MTSSTISAHYNLGMVITVNSLEVRNGELHSPSLNVEYVHKLFGILLFGRLVCSPLPYFFMAAWTHGERTLLIVSQHCFSFCLWSLGILSVSCVPLTHCHQMCFSFLSGLLSATTYCLRLIFFIVCPSPRARHTLFKEFWLLSVIIIHIGVGDGIRRQDLMSDMLTVTGESSLPGPGQQSSKMCVCIQTSEHTKANRTFMQP